MPETRIDAAFPGGNILVEAIEGDTARLRQDRRSTPVWWFYWYFRVRHAAGRTLRFCFTDGDVFGSQGPCFSRDGWVWEWLGLEAVEGQSFTYAFPPALDEAYFCFCIPYVEAHLRAFLAGQPNIEQHTLALSEQGRPIEHLILPSAQGRYKAVLTARHHACEGTANYLLEGLLAFCAGDTPEARFLREQVDLHAIPFIDKDGVEQGDQGKLRAPHDPWEDYTDAPLYAAPRALMAQANAWRGQFALLLDLHCPWIRGGINEQIFIVEPEPLWLPELRRFAGLLEQTQQGALRFNALNSIPFGTDWNVQSPNAPAWFRHHTLVPLAITLEFPYARVGEQVVSIENARAFGADLARAIARYVQGL